MNAADATAIPASGGASAGRLRRFFAWLWRREDAVFGRWEMALMRLLFALVMFDAGSKLVTYAREGNQALPFKNKWGQVTVIPRTVTYTGQPHPHGIAVPLAKLGVPLTFLSKDEVSEALYWTFVIALGFYVIGVGLPVSLGVLFVIMLLHGTFHNSQGSIHHHLQLITCVVGVQWIASLVAACRRGGARQWLRLDAAAENRLVNWTQQVIVAGYVVSALSKLAMSKGEWMWKTPRFGIQLAKATDQDYYDHLRPGTETPAWLPDWCLENPWKARLLFGPALPLEFFAFIALRNRRLAALYALALIVFHLSVSALMSLDFRYNVQMMIVYLINVPFWFWLWTRKACPAPHQAAARA